MGNWIALFRGINVGGRNILPMKELVQELEALRLDDVKTYIQSGNAVFRSTREVSATLGAEISASIEKRRGFSPQVLILSAGDLESAVESNPFPEAVAEPKTLHLLFLAEPATSPDTESIARAQAPSERFHLTDSVFYLHAPDGIGRSKLAANAERFLGVAGTGRNWRTVQKLSEMVRDC